MVKVLNQPADGAMGYVLEEILSGGTQFSFNTFYFLVAYAKRSGVGRIISFLKKFRNNGGEIKAVVGIDQKNTSYEALMDLLEICNELYVYHNEDFSRTYHPKLYLFESVEKEALVSIGSSNLTAGGLYTNYEINAIYNLDLLQESDSQKFFELVSVFQYYTNPETGCSFLVNPDFIENLLRNKYINKEDELRKSIVNQIRTNAERKVRIFSRQSFPEPPARTVVPQQDRRIVVAQSTDIGFWKKLSKNDVSLTSSPGQIIIPISFLEYFPPLSDPIITQSGAEQSDAFFNVIYESPSGDIVKIENARVIFYEPAPWHPRPNSEIRFTFRNHEILTGLGKEDLLEFRRSYEPSVWFIIRHIKPTSDEYENYQGRFSTL